MEIRDLEDNWHLIFVTLGITIFLFVYLVPSARHDLSACLEASFILASICGMLSGSARKRGPVSIFFCTSAGFILAPISLTLASGLLHAKLVHSISILPEMLFTGLGLAALILSVWILGLPFGYYSALGFKRLTRNHRLTK